MQNYVLKKEIRLITHKIGKIIVENYFIETGESFFTKSKLEKLITFEVFLDILYTVIDTHKMGNIFKSLLNDTIIILFVIKIIEMEESVFCQDDLIYRDCSVYDLYEHLQKLRKGKDYKNYLKRVK